MENETSITGEWWLPSTPEIKVHGDATFVPSEGTTLVLEGCLIEEQHMWLGGGDFIDPPVINGLSRGGQAVTLIDCRQIGAQEYPAHGLSETTFRATTMVVGGHFATRDSVMFEGLSIQYANLHEWINKRGLSTDLKDHTVWAKAEQLEATRIRVGSMKLDFSVSASFSENRESIHLVEKAFVKTWTDQAISIDEHLRWVRLIQNFLTFAMLQPTLPLEIQAFSDANTEELPNGARYHRPLQVYFPVAVWLSKPAKVHAHDMLFIMSAVEPKLQDMMMRWVEKSEELAPVYNLYFSTLYNPTVYTEFRFLSLAQAIESYHKRVYGGQYQPDDEYQNGLYRTLVSALPADLDKDFAQSLKEGRLRYANDYSLRKRLALLAAHVSQTVPFTFIKDMKQLRLFADRVADTRNYLTHYSPAVREKAARTGREYAELADQLKAVIEVCLLEELGFDAETISKLIKRNRRYHSYFGS